MTRVIDFASLDFAALKASVDDEARADLLAAAGRLGEAVALMKQVNAAREREFGPWPINELREFTHLALNNQKDAQ